MKVFSIIADIFSVLGFVFTIAVLIKVRGIHRGFLAQARLPSLRKKIRGHCSTLSTLLNDFPSAGSDIEAEIRKCHANLENLLPKLENKQATSVKTLIAFTAGLLKQSSPPDKDQVRKLYAVLVGLEEELGNLSEDMQWKER